MIEFIDLKTQYKLLKPEIDLAINEVLQSAHFIMGSAIDELEQKLASFVESKHAISVSSGTDGLLLALMALGIQPGDEVITVPFTWVSPVEVIRRLKATPVFVDIDPETYLMDPSKIEEAITERTKAIIPVSLYGQMPDFDQIGKIAKKYGLHVVEDGAQSFGATQRGQNSCNVATIGVTSFFPTKPLGCYGDGGAVFTNDSVLAEKIKAMRVHGAPERYNHQYVGMNGRMDTLQAAVLLAKLPSFKEELLKRISVGEYYSKMLRGEFVVPKVCQGNTHVYAQYALRSENRDQTLLKLKQASIPYAVYYPICIHRQPAYLDLGYAQGSFPVAEQVASEVFSIPMHPWLTQEEQDSVVKALKSSILQTV